MQKNFFGKIYFWHDSRIRYKVLWSCKKIISTNKCSSSYLRLLANSLAESSPDFLLSLVPLIWKLRFQSGTQWNTFLCFLKTSLSKTQLYLLSQCFNRSYCPSYQIPFIVGKEGDWNTTLYSNIWRLDVGPGGLVDVSIWKIWR